MVLELAKQAVQIKCGFENARMTGNYELAYALGILSSQAGCEKAEAIESMAQLKKDVLMKAESFVTEDSHVQKLIELIQEYEPSEQLDDQMLQLYQWGFADKKL
ncbi:MAG: DUF3837 domain-containing protein [Lachnospira sp.]|nr:DUF3837 domain-containing protein [Lachnospira sp.]